jgi:hypothetical protein
MDNKILLIGTHHKTGTVWMNEIFYKFAKENNYIFRHTNFDVISNLSGNIIFFSHNSNFEKIQKIYGPNLKSINVIRDPRDIAISGARYHSKVTEGEEWILRPFKNNKSYFEIISSIYDENEKILFEANNITKFTSREMFESSKKENTLNIKYEDLINDLNNFKILEIISMHFNFTKKEFESLKKIYTDTHLKNRKEKINHIINGSINQYELLPEDIIKKMNSIFIKELIYFDYKV